MSRAAAGAKLRGLYSGRFKGVQVVERGRSPRVVLADVIGSRGRTRVSGATLRARFGLYDTWAYFTAIKARVAPVPPPPTTAPSTGGTGAVTAGLRPVASVAGTVLPARRGALVTVQRLDGGRWSDITSAIVGRGGRYRAAVTASGTYRVRYKGDAGPAVRVG